MSFRLIHLLSKCCCVMPLKIGADGGAQVDVVALTISAICMALAITESIYGTFWIARSIASNLSMDHETKVNSMLSVIAKVVTIVQIGAISFKLLIGRHSLAKLTNELNFVQNVLFKKKTFSWEILVTSFVMVVTTLTTFFAYLQAYEDSENGVWYTVVNYLVTLVKFVNCCVISGLNLQFWGFCQMFRTSFKEINYQLESTKRSFAEKRAKNYGDALTLLLKLRFCRSRLCDAVDTLNELFGMCVLLALLSYNIYVHLVVYLVLTELIGFIYDVTNEMNFGTTLVWLAIDIFFISTYFQGCVRTSLEVEKTSKILSNMSHSLPSGSLRDTVYWFLTEVNARPIIFSAYGVFRIDLQLLFVSVASCAVNMAILLQSNN